MDVQSPSHSSGDHGSEREAGSAACIWESDSSPLRFLSQEHAGLDSGGPVTGSQTRESGKMRDEL